MEKNQIVTVLEEMSLLLELAEANAFEIMAYRNGAQSLDDWQGDLEEAIERGALTEIHGIGKGLAAVITDLARTGRSKKHDDLKGQFPQRLLELMRVPGLGVKKIRTLHRELHIDSLDALEQAARNGEIRALPGFGARSEERILSGVARARRYLSAG